MVEVLAAGLTGANWSLDAPSFTEGSDTPGSGMFVLAIEPNIIQADFALRLDRPLTRLSNEYGVHIPGRAKRESRRRAAEGGLEIPLSVVEELEAAAGQPRDR